MVCPKFYNTEVEKKLCDQSKKVLVGGAEVANIVCFLHLVVSSFVFCSISKTDYHLYPFSSIDVQTIGCTYFNFEFQYCAVLCCAALFLYIFRFTQSTILRERILLSRRSLATKIRKFASIRQRKIMKQET